MRGIGAAAGPLFLSIRGQLGEWHRRRVAAAQALDDAYPGCPKLAESSCPRTLDRARRGLDPSHRKPTP